MPETTALVPNNPAIDLLRPGATRDGGRCVLLWVQRAKRASSNRAANLAVAVADALGLPVVALFCLAPGYPRATLRSYTFLAEGLRELPDAFLARGIGWALRVGDPIASVLAAADDLGAAAVVTDQDPLREGRRWRADLAAALPVPLVGVDADVVAPSSLFPKEEYAAHTLRPKLWRAIRQGTWLRAIADPSPRVRNDVSRLRSGPDPIAALDAIAMDRAVPPSPLHRGGRAEGLRRLDRFVQDRLGAYHTDRDNPVVLGQSQLSPYLHFGFLGPVEVARAALAARGRLDTWPAPSRTLAPAEANAHPADPALDAFLDELVTQRELAINFALRNSDYDRYAGLPDWGRTTLANHAADPRPVLYDEARLTAGETGDRLWNAAQRQMVAEGWMPNRLRMYWGKQLLLWTASPEEAFDRCAELNDRWFLCGRDAAGYANIAWTIGGRHDRPFPPNKPIFGLVRPMALSGMRRKFDADAYVAQVEALTGAPIGPAPERGPVRGPARARQRRLLPDAAPDAEAATR